MRFFIYLNLFYLLCLIPFKLYGQANILDNSFGNNGFIKIERGFSTDPYAFKILPNGEIMIYVAAIDSLFQMRFRFNGELDTTFGIHGVKHEVYPKIGGAFDISILPDNKYLVLRSFSEGSFIPEVGFAVTKHHLNDDLDTTFGVAGKSFIRLGTYAVPATMAIQQDNKILILGVQAQLKGTITRFNSDGQIDSTFDGNGIALVPMGFPAAVGQLSNGKIICSGSRGSGFPDIRIALSCLNPNGSLDLTFGANGSVNTYFGRETEVSTSMVIRPNDKILLGGWLDPLKNEFMLVQYNSDGSLDNDFGTQGLVTTSFPTPANITKIHLLPDGKILAFGSLQVETSFVQGQSIIARYNANGTLDSTFFEDGIETFMIEYSSYITREDGYNDGSFLVSGSFSYEFNGPPQVYLAKIPDLSISGNYTAKANYKILIDPNPANEYVHFRVPDQLNDATLRIFDSTGHLRFEKFHVDKDFVWRTENTPSGFYYYRLTAKGMELTGKIVLDK
jgi:uncharacterized delta-60 repeat protein